MKKIILAIVMIVVMLTALCSCVPSGQMCMLCGDKKATKEYESALGTVYVCSDCYKEVMKLNKDN